MENFEEGEKKEMVEIYMRRGFSASDASAVIEILSRNTEFFVDHMLIYELDMMPPDPSQRPALQGRTRRQCISFRINPMSIYLSIFFVCLSRLLVLPVYFLLMISRLISNDICLAP